MSQRCAAHRVLIVSALKIDGDGLIRLRQRFESLALMISSGWFRILDVFLSSMSSCTSCSLCTSPWTSEVVWSLTSMMLEPSGWAIGRADEGWVPDDAAWPAANAVDVDGRPSQRLSREGLTSFDVFHCWFDVHLPNDPMLEAGHSQVSHTPHSESQSPSQILRWRWDLLPLLIRGHTGCHVIGEQTRRIQVRIVDDFGMNLTRTSSSVVEMLGEWCP